MSTKRVARWQDYPARKVDGKWLCRWCGKPCTGRRRSFCSAECSHELLIRTDPNYLRHLVWERDHGICALCGMDTEAKRKELKVIRKSYGRAFWLETLKQFKIPETRAHSSLWDADHIHAVIEGGGECGLENMRTLCIWCHRKVTAALRKRRAQEKKCQNHGRILLPPSSLGDVESG